MKKNYYKNIYYLLCIIYALFLGFSFYDNFTKGYTHSLSMCFVSLILVFCTPLLFKTMKMKPVYEIYILAIIFIFLASLLGSTYRFYNTIPYWDKYVHCFSGVLGAMLSYILFCSLKKKNKINKEDHILMYLFINAFNISIATAWELFEYAGLVFFDYDGIRHYVSGVHDSMSDIIVCIIGGIFTTFFIYRFYKTGKENIFTRISSTFFNQKKDNFN